MTCIGEIVFTYIVDNTRSFRENWDDRIDSICKKLVGERISVSILNDEAEYDYDRTEVKGVLRFNFEIDISINYDTVFKGIVNKIIRDIQTGKNGVHVKLVYSLNTFGKKTLKFRDDSEKQPEADEILKKIKVSEITKQPDTIKQPEAKSVEVKKPKFTKVIDETKTKLKNRTFEIVKTITDIDGIYVNGIIVRQLRGSKDRKRYTLTRTDCELLEIEYVENLEILPVDLKYENVYKKISNTCV